MLNVAKNGPCRVLAENIRGKHIMLLDNKGLSRILEYGIPGGRALPAIVSSLGGLLVLRRSATSARSGARRIAERVAPRDSIPLGGQPVRGLNVMEAVSLTGGKEP